MAEIKAIIIELGGQEIRLTPREFLDAKLMFNSSVDTKNGRKMLCLDSERATYAPISTAGRPQ